MNGGTEVPMYSGINAEYMGTSVPPFMRQKLIKPPYDWGQKIVMGDFLTKLAQKCYMGRMSRPSQTLTRSCALGLLEMPVPDSLEEENVVAPQTTGVEKEGEEDPDMSVSVPGEGDEIIEEEPDELAPASPTSPSAKKPGKPGSPKSGK
eukprot:NODE_8274_length_712_cov_81.220713_g8020_i0.p1 GENE.NODE_8274_length_712_cov_81.220713_g8020_i0~~NODE_8274_length_712_cov_81.220713_g8020_i0.p1  ORF type:complete len:149 (+),score=44.06 NODE_8274_length_712_cov_81.220713_g8020_i0:44-490(+)